MAATLGGTQRVRPSFFPRADGAMLPSKQYGPSPARPTSVWPVFDPESLNMPLPPWHREIQDEYFPAKAEEYAPAFIPEKPAERLPERYLRPALARNEHLRLSMLWYYTRDILDQHEFLRGLQEKLAVAHESSGWEYVVIGGLDINVYIRLAAFGLLLAILPRGETTCSHTISQPPGSVFLMPNMTQTGGFQSRHM
ncbi:hypothetical protein GGR57DRAFT_35765 [Xylariaceae sp. FL1272]|nr:hypothetical protein GGR57DRAFT_35765 [Xylariaceae sp. FL1272]